MDIRVVSTTEAPKAIGPYSQAVTVDGWVYTSGQIPLLSDGSLVEGGVDKQVEQVLQNLLMVLKAAGVGPTNVVKATIFMQDLADFAIVNEAYARFFGEHRPARSTVQVAGLPRGALVEIELIARRPE